MAACWRCGSTIAADAIDCPECGARVRSELADIELLVAEQPPKPEFVEATDGSPSRWLLVIPFVLIAGVVAFFAVAADDEQPSADPFEDRANFDAIDDAVAEERDEPAIETITGTVVGDLEWNVAHTGGIGLPIATVAIGSDRFVYALDGPAAWSAGGTLRAYQRTPGDGWAEVATTIESTATVTSVQPTPEGAVAVGLDSAGDPTLWRTGDGTTWIAETLPMPGDGGTAPLSSLMRDAIPWLAASVGDLTVVVGSAPDPGLEVYEIVRDRYPEIGQGLRTDWDHDADIVNVRGPFGVILDQIDLTELGIDLEALNQPASAAQPMPVWHTTGAGWTADSVSGPIYGIHVAGDRIARIAETSRGPELTFFDAGGWSEPRAIAGEAWHLRPWRDDFVVTAPTDRLLVVDDLGEIISEAEIPAASAMGQITGIAAGEAGVAIAESIWEPRRETWSTEEATVLRNGYTLAADDGVLTLSLGDDIITRSSVFWEGGTDRYDVDTDGDEATVWFLGRDGERLVSFTITELAELETAALDAYTPTTRTRVLFSPDGSTWAGGTLDGDALFGFAQPFVGDEALITTQLEETSTYWDPAQAEYRFAIMEAPLPG